MKAALVDSHRARIQRIESGEQIVVGQNRFTETEVSPLTADAEGGILVVDPAVEAEQIEAVRRWRAERDQQAVDAALAELARVAASEQNHENLMVPTIAAARAGATTGEWAHTLREVFGSYRAPDGRGRGKRGASRRRAFSSCARKSPTWPRSSVAARRSLSASQASTAIRTAPSRSRCVRATPAWTWSMKASA